MEDLVVVGRNYMGDLVVVGRNYIGSLVVGLLGLE